MHSSDTPLFQNKTSAVLLLAQLQFQEQVPYLGEFIQPALLLLNVPAHSHHTCSPFAMILQDVMCHLASRTPPTGSSSFPPSNNLFHSNCPSRNLLWPVSLVNIFNVTSCMRSFSVRAGASFYVPSIDCACVFGCFVAVIGFTMLSSLQLFFSVSPFHRRLWPRLLSR